MIIKCSQSDATGMEPRPKEYNNALQLAIQDQNQLEWINWYQGIIAKSVQDLFMTAKNNEKSTPKIIMEHTIDH